MGRSGAGREQVRKDRDRAGRERIIYVCIGECGFWTSWMVGELRVWDYVLRYMYIYRL